MKVGYISGPYRDRRGVYYIRQNICAAEKAAIELWRAGFAVICPHKNTALFDGAAPDEVWLKGDLELIRRSDFVVMIGDWNKSEGACEERRVALSERKRVYTSIKEAIEWENR